MSVPKHTTTHDSHREEPARMPLSGPRVWDDLTAQTRTREAPRRQTTGTPLPATVGRGNRGPRPADMTRGSLNGIRTPRLPAVEPSGVAREENRKRRSGAWKSLSGSCAGDYLTATTVKEKPRRQTTGTRLRVTIGHDDRGPRPPVCAHGPLNESQAFRSPLLAGSSHSRSSHRRPPGGASDFHNDSATRSVVPGVASSHSGTSRRRTAFQ